MQGSYAFMMETHALTKEGKQELDTLLATMREASKNTLSLMPDGREKSLFETKIKEALYFGVRAVCLKEGNKAENSSDSIADVNSANELQMGRVLREVELDLHSPKGSINIFVHTSPVKFPKA